MFWIFFWAYIAIGVFVAGPVICNHLYAKARQNYYNDKGEIHRQWTDTYDNRQLGRAGKKLTFKEVQDLIWNVDRHGIVPFSMLGGLVWPVSLYIIVLKYSASYRDMKERQRQIEQKQQEEDLARARKILAESRQEDSEQWVSAFGKLDKSADKLTAKLGRNKR